MRHLTYARVATLGLLAVLLVPAFTLASAAPGTVHSPHVPTVQQYVGRYAFNTSDPAAFPNSGVMMELESFAMPAYAGNGSATFQVGVGEGLTSSLFFVTGLEADWGLSGTSVMPFAAVLNATTQNLTSFVTEPAAPPGSLLRFALQHTTGGTWEAYINGAPVLSVNAGVSSVTSPLDTGALLNFSSGSAPWLPGTVFFPQVMMVGTGSSWYVPNDLYASWFGGTFAAPLNVSGASLNKSLAPGELLIGTNVSSPSRGIPAVELWNGTSPAMAALNATATPPTVVGGHHVAVAWHVTSGGNGVAGANLDVFSSLGGPFQPLQTSPTGWANLTWDTSPVQQPSVLYLNATLMNDKYTGWGSVAIGILPPGAVPLQVFLTLRAAASPPSDTFEVIVQVTDNQTPVAGLALLPSANVGGGAFSPAAPWISDARGFAYANYTAPLGAPAVTVWVNVSRQGFTGSAFQNLTLTPPAPVNPPSPSNDNGWLLDAIVGGVAAGALFNAGVWIYRQRSSKMVKRLDRLEPGSLVGGSEGEEEPDAPEDPE